MISLHFAKMIVLTLFYFSLTGLAIGLKRGLASIMQSRERSSPLSISQNENHLLEQFSVYSELSEKDLLKIPHLQKKCEKLLEHPSVPVTIEAGNLLVRLGALDSINALENHINSLNS